MKILISPDSFKDSLPATEVADQIEAGIRKVYPEAECLKVPMADGGEGTVRAIIGSTGGKILRLRAMDPLMREADSFFGITGDGAAAVIEMAAASGLELLKPEERNPLLATSYGTGQLLLAALKTGIKNIIVGLGGSATNDGGAGMAEALGVEFTDQNNHIIHPRGDNLDVIVKINTSKLEPSLRDAQIIIATDVKNVMCGPCGASYIFGPQKGATLEMTHQLDKNLRHYGELLENIFKKPVMDLPGTGAAGGLAASLMVFTDATIKPGFEVVNELVGFESLVRAADIIITGEGKMDSQTLLGKTPWAIRLMAKKYNKPVIAITGHYEADESLDQGFDAIFPIVEYPCTLEYTIGNAPDLIRHTAERIMKMVLLNPTL